MANKKEVKKKSGMVFFSQSLIKDLKEVCTATKIGQN